MSDQGTSIIDCPRDNQSDHRFLVLEEVFKAIHVGSFVSEHLSNHVLQTLRLNLGHLGGFFGLVVVLGLVLVAVVRIVFFVIVVFGFAVSGLAVFDLTVFALAVFGLAVLGLAGVALGVYLGRGPLAGDSESADSDGPLSSN